ncbi:class I SAM-dependent methyltransferase [Kitasatospora sp. NPDC057542]|uniref:class I SAM-dependent methyltransferase n=1 Tax=Streptomycetaceae TaxID=2062 RepID=UPI001CCA4470|nr:class I SAM-dependent methyltransferase [Streptomyces sp. LS1784]
MGAAEQVDRTRARVFGEAAELYDAARPGYADALVTDVLAYAELGGRPAVEVGAGTGKATVLFAGRGVPLVCVEPDPRMAEVLRRNTGGYPQVRVENGGFEEWAADGREFGLLFAATSWHWLDQARRWDLVHDALGPGGAVALFWNPHGVLDGGPYDELAEVDRKFGVENAPHGQRASFYGPEAGGGDPGWPEPECRRDGRFADLRAVRYREEVWYETGRYLDFLASVSTYRVLPEERREGVLAETARVLDARGGGIGMLRVNDLFLARRGA